MINIAFLDNIVGFGKQDWSKHWVVGWFLFGIVVLFVGFWQTTERAALDWFYLGVSYVGLLCVVGLSFRKNIIGNGFGMLATSGEVIVQATAGAVGLMLAPLFNFFTHACGVVSWQKNTSSDGDMLPQAANKYVWVITTLFIITGLVVFPSLNDWLIHQGYGIIDDDGGQFLGAISFFWVNVVAFILSITAQAAMMMRYSFSWWLWTVVNCFWLTVNVMSDNYIFAIQTCVYQLNTIVGLYGWHKSQQNSPATSTHLQG